MKTKILKTVTLGAAALSLTMGQSVLAWGPERPLYTMENPAHKATFNSITDNAAVGDERDFVRIEEKDSGRTYSSEIKVEPGKKYEVYIYYHNDASETFNDQAHGFVGVARETRLATMFPTKLEKGERGTVFGRISSSTTEPEAVWDEAYITATEAMTLHYVNGTAKIYNGWGVNGQTLSTNIFTDKGTFIGLNELNGLILGCDRYSGQIVYTIETKAIDPDNPVEPEPPVPDDKFPDDNPPAEEKPTTTPEELPTTGPMEIIVATVIILAVAAGGIYWFKMSRDVKHATSRAKGKGRKK